MIRGEFPNKAIVSPVGVVLLESVQVILFQGEPMIDMRFSHPSGDRFLAVFDRHGQSFFSAPAEGPTLINHQRS